MHPQPATSSPSSSSLSSRLTSAEPADNTVGGDVSALWSRVASSALMSHFNSLYVAVSSVGLLPPVCEQIHLGVVDAAQFRTLMELLHTVGRQGRGREAGGQTRKGHDDSLDGGQTHSSPTAATRTMTTTTTTTAASDSNSPPSSTSDGSAAVPSSSLSPSSNSSQSTSPGTAESTHSPQSAHDSLALPPSSSSPSTTSTATLSSSRARGVRSTVFSPSSSRVMSVDRESVGVIVERDRFCKPSRLITVYPSKPFLITPIHLERIYVTSRKAAESMADDEKAELATITVRWMGKPTADELFLVATDVCALINIRKSNTAKTVAQFADGEKVSMPVHCSSGKGSSTHILTVLTLAGVRRLLTTSRSVLATSLLDYLTRIAVHLQHFPHYVPVNDPLKPTVTPLKAEQQQSQLVANPAASGLSPPLMPPPPPPSSADIRNVSASVTESAMFPSLPYPLSDSHSVSTSSTGSTFMSPVAAALTSSSVHDDTSDAEHILGGCSSNTPLPPPLSASLNTSLAEPPPPLSVSGAVSVSGWTVKLEHDEVDNSRSERSDNERQKKRRLDDSSTDTNEQTQQRRSNYQTTHLDDSSPLPLPLGDDSRTSLYAATVSRTMSNGQQSPAAPDSPSGLSYSHYHPGSLILPPLHYTHSPPFMSTQPPTLPFGEVSDMMMYPPPYHPPYYPAASRPQHGYYLSPQHRPLTAPPMQSFTHHNLALHSKPIDEYANSAHAQQQDAHCSTSGLIHSPASVVLSNNNNNNNTTPHPANGELTLPPPLYQPIQQHSQTATCNHCHHTQHQQLPSGGMYSNRRPPLPISPPPPPPPPTTTTYHSPYNHNTATTNMQQHTQPPARSSFNNYTNPPPSYTHSSSHHTYHHTGRYTPS